MGGSSENIQFSWGNKRGRGGAKMDTQFYDSFTFDSVKYSLYDTVYLFKNGDPEPYVGKIVKIWQQNEAKKVKILWFFFPDEIRNYLRGPVMEKEIFLASGEGAGLTDINPLEAIAGKCTVVCITKDERNRQPSPREKVVADYIFYRFFDVGNCILLDQVPEKIAGHEVNILLNPKDEQVTSYPDQKVQGMDQKVDAGLVAAVPLPQSAVNEEDASPVAAVPLPQSVVWEEDKKQAAAVPLPPAVEETVSKPKQNIPKRTQEFLSEKMLSKKLKLSQDITVQNTVPDVPDVKVHPGPLDLTTRQADRSKWFKMTWDVRLKFADEQGTLVYIQNLDIQFGASDIEVSLRHLHSNSRNGNLSLSRPCHLEKAMKIYYAMELVHEALQLRCTAKPINHPTYDDPNNGKAYAVFKNKIDADAAISKINSGLVVGGRPLYCSKGLLKVPKPPLSGALVGHLTVSNQKMSQRQREEQKAVSTSHCSQPNTIEYELALDWMLDREKQATKFRILQKKHMEERKSFATMMRK